MTIKIENVAIEKRDRGLVALREFVLAMKELEKIDEELNPGNGFKELTNKVERPDLGKIKEEVKN